MHQIHTWYFTHEKKVNIAIDIISIGLLLVTLFCGLSLILNAGALVWVDLFSDDAYYYFGIARNIVEHGNSSFLPPFETNGYQPLWLMLLTVTGYLFGTSDIGLVIQAYLMSFLFVVLFFSVSAKRYRVGFPAILCSLTVPIIMLQGMETTMLPAFFILFVTSSSWKMRGIFGALLFLTRLDTLTLVVARDIYLYISKQENNYRHYLIIIPIVLIYASVNYYYFGIPVPVSGLAKSAGNILGENFPVGFGYFIWLRRAAIIFSCILVCLLAQKKYISRLHFKNEYAILLIACFLCILYYSTMSGWPIWPWYYWSPFLITYYLLLEILFQIKELPKSNGKYFYNGLTVILLVGLSIMFKPSLSFVKKMIDDVRLSSDIQSLAESYGKKNVILANWIKQQKIPENTMFAMGDRAGSFGFFLGNHFQFLHTEGLVGPISYYKALVNDNAINFVNSQNIHYWVAEREQFIEAKNIIGVIEPVQGLSSHRGPYVICFNKEGILLDQSYIAPEYQSLQKYEYRYVLDMRNRVDCPIEIKAKLDLLRKNYGGVREFSLPLEHITRDSFAKSVNLHM